MLLLQLLLLVGVGILLLLAPAVHHVSAAAAAAVAVVWILVPLACLAIERFLRTTFFLVLNGKQHHEKKYLFMIKL